MAFAGTHAGRSKGVKGSKIKILLNKKGNPRRRLPKVPLPETDERDLQEQSSIYLREHNAQMRAKRLKAEMELAHARGLLIEKTLVERQLGYLLIGMRQKLLALPGNPRTKIGGAFTHEMLVCVKELVHDALTEISRQPESVDPDWTEWLEK
jgi:hypothetical protein